MEEDKKHWYLLGGIYFNRKDPRILVPKRFGIGQTINFGQVLTKKGIGFLILVGIAIGVYTYVRHH